MSTSGIGTRLDAIRAALVADAGLSGVNVFSGPVGEEEAGQECIAFGNGKLTEVELAHGGSRLETWEITGDIRVLKPWQGTTETSIKAARDRVLAILAEFESYLNDTYTGTMPDVRLTDAEMSSGIHSDGRECWLSFTFEMRGVKNP